MKRTKEPKKKEFEEADERSIITGLVVSTEFIKSIRDVWDIQFMEAKGAKIVALICIEYYDEYLKAPHKEFQELFERKKASGKYDLELMEELEEDILPGLSKQLVDQEEEFNVKFLLDGTNTRFKRRKWELHCERVNALIAEGKREEAEKLAQEFKPFEITSTNKLDKFIWNLDEMRNLDIEKTPLLMEPWLSMGQITFIYGDFATGKSLLAIHIASLLALEDPYDHDYDIGQWQVKRSTGCLYVDGEMGVVDLRDRLSQFEYLGKQEFPLLGFPLPQYQLATEDDFILSDRENQLQIVHWLKRYPDYKLIILDSVTTLFGLTDENSNAEWNNKINPLLRDLKALGVAVILLHHSGKDSSRGLRGASAMGAMAHNIFCLTNHTDKDIDEGEAWFVLTKKKQRAGGFQFKSFAIHYTQNSDATETDWEVTDKTETKDEGLNEKQIRIIRLLLHGGYKQKDIAERVGCDQSNVSYAIKKAKELHYLDVNGKATQLWNELINKFTNTGEE